MQGSRLVTRPSCRSMRQSLSVSNAYARRRLDTLLKRLSSSSVHRVIKRKDRFDRLREPFRTRARKIGSTVVLLIAASIIVTGLYYGNARPSSVSCTNGAVNYPSCDSCSSTEVYNLSIHACECGNGNRNAPYCTRPCANNALNYPACDVCPDATDVRCPPY